MIPQVLFVDDESGIRDGLRRAMRRYRERFECHFASSATDAQALLETQRFDLALIDLSLPDIDGISLLAFMRDHHPTVIRAAFSGTCEIRACIDALTFAHRFVSKPCTPERLAEHIAECLDVGAGCHNRLVAALRSLSEPTALPAVHAAVLRELAAPEPSLRAVVDAVGGDIGITTRLLKLANSSWFGARKPTTSLDRACAQLGFDNVRAAVLLLGVMGDRHARFGLGDIGDHGLLVGEIASELVEPGQQGDARTAGLLHDIGRLAFARVAPHEYAATAAEHADDEDALAAAETLRFGGNHAQCGGFLLSLWGLPTETAVAITGHHQEPECSDGRIGVADALRLAELVCAGRIDQWLEHGTLVPRARREEIAGLVLARGARVLQRAS